MAHVIIDDLGVSRSYTVGASARSVFPIPFAFFALTDIVVTINGAAAVYGTDYSVTGTAAEGGYSDGTMTLVDEVTDSVVVVERVLVIERTTDFPNSGPFNIPALNTQFDRLVAFDQQLEQGLVDVNTTMSNAVELLDAVTGAETSANFYPSRAAAVLATISPLETFVMVMGYYVAGDAPPATYKRVASAPTHPGYFQSADGAYWEIVGNDLYLKQFGGMGDGTNQKTALDNAVATLAAKGGGTVRLGGHVLISSWDNPYTGTAPPRSTPLRITGEEGMDFDGLLAAGHTGGTILEVADLANDGRIGKMQSFGAGTLEIDHMTVKSGEDDFLMMFMTNTTPNFHDLSWFGNPSKSGRSCVQPGIRFGDLTAASAVLGGVLPTNGFQGYPGQLRNVQFSHLSECLQFGGSANSIVVDNCGADYTCGSASAANGAFTLYGAGIGIFSNQFRSFYIEMTNYKYGVYMKDVGGGCGYNDFIGFYIGDSDPAYSLAAFYFEANTGAGTIIPGFVDGALTLMAGPGANSNAVVNNRTRTSYVPVFTTSAGTLAYTILDANYKNVGGLISGKVRASFTTVGSGRLDVTLPTKIATTDVLWGQNLTTKLGLTGLCGQQNNTTASIYKAVDGSYPVANGDDIEIAFEYEPTPG